MERSRYGFSPKSKIDKVKNSYIYKESSAHPELFFLSYYRIRRRYSKPINSITHHPLPITYIFRQPFPAFTTRFFAPFPFPFQQKELKHAVQSGLGQRSLHHYRLRKGIDFKFLQSVMFVEKHQQKSIKLPRSVMFVANTASEILDLHRSAITPHPSPIKNFSLTDSVDYHSK